ncbi:hypothetical protein HZ996_04815 [Cryomorphaceae bacterium]|nr:hypothetical protein HZ996_04815 [Cryomorphaceae bacterium]
MQKGYRLKPNFFPSDSLQNGFMGAPRLQYFIVSWLPEKWWAIFGNALNIIYDILSVILIYVIFGDIHAEQWHFSPSFWIALVFGSSPILFSITARLTGVKARTLGLLLILMYLSCLKPIVLESNYAFIIPAVVLGVLSISASAFAMQNLVFLSISVSVLLGAPNALLVLLFVFIAAWFDPFLGTKKVLIHKINHYWWYAKSYSGTTASDKNRISDFFKLPHYLVTKPLRFLEIVLKKNSYTVLLISTPWIWFLLWAYLNGFDLHQTKTDMLWSFAIVASTLIIFFLTTLRPFLLFGEAERYFEYGAAYLSSIGVTLIISWGMSEVILAILVLVQASIVLVFLIYRLKGVIKKGLDPLVKNDHLDDCIAFLRNGHKAINVLTIPLKYGYYLGFHTYDSGIKLYHMFISNEIDGFKYMRNDLAKYDYPKEDIHELVDQYDLDYMVVSKRYHRKDIQDYDFTGLGYAVAHENPEFVVYSLKKE